MQRRNKKSKRKERSISWKNEKDVEALTNNQLKMYLKRHGLKISGSKADLTKHAARDVLEGEEFNNSCEDDTTSESESSDSDGENSYVEESCEVRFVPEEDIQYVN